MPNKKRKKIGYIAKKAGAKKYVKARRCDSEDDIPLSKLISVPSINPEVHQQNGSRRKQVVSSSDSEDEIPLSSLRSMSQSVSEDSHIQGVWQSKHIKPNNGQYLPKRQTSFKEGSKYFPQHPWSLDLDRELREEKKRMGRNNHHDDVLQLVLPPNFINIGQQTGRWKILKDELQYGTSERLAKLLIDIYYEYNDLLSKPCMKKILGNDDGYEDFSPFLLDTEKQHESVQHVSIGPDIANTRGQHESDDYPVSFHISDIRTQPEPNQTDGVIQDTRWQPKPDQSDGVLQDTRWQPKTDQTYGVLQDTRWQPKPDKTDGVIQDTRWQPKPDKTDGVIQDTRWQYRPNVISNDHKNSSVTSKQHISVEGNFHSLDNQDTKGLYTIFDGNENFSNISIKHIKQEVKDEMHQGNDKTSQDLKVSMNSVFTPDNPGSTITEKLNSQNVTNLEKDPVSAQISPRKPLLDNHKTHANNTIICAGDAPRTLYICSYCPMQFWSPDRYKRHEEIHLSYRYHCMYCDRTFPHKASWKTHESEHKGKNTLKCQHYGERYSRYNIYSEHERTHTGEDPYMYQCRHCGKKFISSLGKNAHQRQHGLGSEKPQKCQFCFRRFAEKKELIRHKRIHIGHKSYKCQYCEKIFMEKAICIGHERLHRGERPYSCRFCEKTFIYRETCKQHQLAHSGVDNENVHF
ncbi:zinc finger protein 135 isoform X2 [Lingula anatina]|nr:zinc finger protein 135 isoform X2 [Lingula anatina]|eukprot:XP_013382978.1 zinc finger protein 135 isoform X2 [Lingula anatina]